MSDLSLIALTFEKKKCLEPGKGSPLTTHREKNTYTSTE